MTRLVELGNPAAKAAAELCESALYASAWRGVIEKAAAPFPDASVTALTSLYRASVEDHDAVQFVLGFDAQLEAALRQADTPRRRWWRADAS